MNKILSQAEVDALLKSVTAPDSTTQDSASQASVSGAGSSSSFSDESLSAQAAPAKRVMVYNFRRPDRVPKSLLRSLQLLHDKFCSNVSSSFSAYLRTVSEVTVVSVEQTTYSEFLMSLADPTFFCAIGMKPLTGMAALEIHLDLVFPLIDRLLGGMGNLPKLNRNITEIEKDIIQSVIKLVTTNLTETWRAVSAIEFQLHSSETRPQLLQIAPPNEVVILIVFEIKLGETRGTMHLCLPFSVLEPISRKFEQEIDFRHKGNQQKDYKSILLRLQKARVPLVAELNGSKMTVKDLLTIAKGDVIQLAIKVSDPINVHVSGYPRFRGQGMIIDNQKAVRILERSNSE